MITWERHSSSSPALAPSHALPASSPGTANSWSTPCRVAMRWSSSATTDGETTTASVASTTSAHDVTKTATAVDGTSPDGQRGLMRGYQQQVQFGHATDERLHPRPLWSSANA